MSRFLRRLLSCIPALIVLASLPMNAADQQQQQQHWIHLASAHFPMLTDANEKQGRETILRFEQMRNALGQTLLKTKLKMPQPLEIIALKTDDEYVRVAPVRQSRLLAPDGFFLAGEDRNYIVLNLSVTDSWQAVSHAYAHLIMNYNYPPTQPWFDEGFAEYFSSLHLDNKQMQIGGDPSKRLSNLPESQSFTTLLSTAQWLPIPELFTKDYSLANELETTRLDLFHAESWIVLHYLINKNLLAETGSYFDLVQNQKLPVDQAMQKAYGVGSKQFEQNVKDYFHSFSADVPTQATANTSSASVQIHVSPVPVGPDDVAASVQTVRESEARALLAEMTVRLPEHREAAIQDLKKLLDAPETESAIGHRALAWGLLQKNDFEHASEELSKAMDMDRGDMWTHYYAAFAKYHAAQVTGKPIQGLANMMQDLRAVLDQNPDFAEAYNMLGLARIEGGGIRSAMEAMRMAIQLAPRNERYLLNMARVQMEAKNWADASTLLNRLRNSRDPEIARSAQNNLNDLPALKKYGMRPQDSQAAARPSPAKPEASSTLENEEEEQPATPAPDTRPIKFLKAKLLRVDCSRSPEAILTFQAGERVVKLQTKDYHSVLLIGEEEFSCEWEGLPVNVNYKEGKKSLGDLVSLEVK